MVRTSAALLEGQEDVGGSLGRGEASRDEGDEGSLCSQSVTGQQLPFRPREPPGPGPGIRAIVMAEFTYPLLGLRPRKRLPNAFHCVNSGCLEGSGVGRTSGWVCGRRQLLGRAVGAAFQSVVEFLMTLLLLTRCVACKLIPPRGGVPMLPRHAHHESMYHHHPTASLATYQNLKF